MDANSKRPTADRLKLEMRALRSTLAGSCSSAIQQIEARPKWGAQEEARILWAQFTQARAALLETPKPEIPTPKARLAKCKKQYDEDIDWGELLGEQ
jgi:hypothetical protein